MLLKFDNSQSIHFGRDFKIYKTQYRYDCLSKIIKLMCFHIKKTKKKLLRFKMRLLSILYYPMYSTNE